MANPRYDDFSRPSDPDVVVGKMNGMMSENPEVGHNHSDVGNGAPIVNAVNVTTKINGHPITDIFMPNGQTVLNAHLADSAIEATHAGSSDVASAASGDVTFQVSGSIGGNFASSYPVAAGASRIIMTIRRFIPEGKRLYLRRACYEIGSTLRIRVDTYIDTGGTPWTSSDNANDVSPDAQIYLGDGTLKRIYIRIYNPTAGSVNAISSDGFWFDFEIAD